MIELLEQSVSYLRVSMCLTVLALLIQARGVFLEEKRRRETEHLRRVATHRSSLLRSAAILLKNSASMSGGNRRQVELELVEQIRIAID